MKYVHSQLLDAFFALQVGAVADGVLLFDCWSRVELRIPYRRVCTESLNAIGPFETSVTWSPRKHEPGKRTKETVYPV